MKKLIIFIILFWNNIILACGFYPYGEEVRFSILNPNHFDFKYYRDFHYTSNYLYYYEDNKNLLSDIEKNWYSYCKEKVPIDEITKAVFDLTKEQLNEKSLNKMVQYLYKTKDIEALNYLKYAKSIEFLNQFYDDPWERVERVELKFVKSSLKKTLELATKQKKKNFQLKYKFLAIRIAFYSGNFETVKEIYATLPSSSKQSFYFYNCMHFRALVEENKDYQNFLISQVFANSNDKRLPIYSFFNRSVVISNVLKFAKTRKEKANVYAVYALFKHDRALEFIKKSFLLNPKNKLNNFLLLREVNKLEDWILTPYYTNFKPPIQETYWNRDTIFSYKAIQKRIANDRIYAKEVIDFLESTGIQDKEVGICKAQLYFMTKNYNKSLQTINYLTKKITKNDNLFKELELIKGLNIIANQQENKAVIPKSLEKIILENQKNNKFIFAIGRELEYLKNYKDAAFLYSKLNKEYDYNNYNNVYWKSKKAKRHVYRDYFNDYFDYINVIYTPEQLNNVLVEAENKKLSGFNKWKVEKILENKTVLYDLLGMKYIRQNKLKQSLKVFAKLDKKYWSMNSYNDPFHSFSYTQNFISKKEKIILTKENIIKKLIEYINKANNPKEKNRDLYYFLVGNCYRNMTKDGNSWNLRRFNPYSTQVEPYPEDEEEFRDSKLAKKYYRLAAKHTKSEKFKALSLFLAKDYKKVKQKNEKMYVDLSYGCDKFQEYFNSRKN